MGRLHPIACVSAETNPDDLGNAELSRLEDVGVNRVSVGVQSFDDSLLKEMQRYEKYGSGQQIRTRLKSVAGTFDTLNIDMIFNRVVFVAVERFQNVIGRLDEGFAKIAPVIFLWTSMLTHSVHQ